LASNSGNESVAKLTDALNRMREEVKDAVGKSSIATKQGLVVSNKVEEAKVKILALERRLSKLESR
jgi:hypothetical protein